MGTLTWLGLLVIFSVLFIRSAANPLQHISENEDSLRLLLKRLLGAANGDANANNVGDLLTRMEASFNLVLERVGTEDEGSGDGWKSALKDWTRAPSAKNPPKPEVMADQKNNDDEIELSEIGEVAVRDWTRLPPSEHRHKPVILEDMMQVKAGDPCLASGADVTSSDGMSGTINSPGYSTQAYPNNAQCQWRITAPYGYKVQVTFTAFNIETGSSCTYDSLSVFDGATSVGKYCGVAAPPRLTSTAQTVTLTFVTDNVINTGGFSLQWSFVSSGGSQPQVTKAPAPGPTSNTDPCRGIYDISGSSGTVKYPASGTYPNNARCQWRITAPAGKVVKVVFNSFGVEQTAGCTYDYLSVYDGTDNKTGTLIGQYCGTLLPAELIRSTGTTLFLYFVSDVDSGSTGFTLTWTAVSPTPASPSNSMCGSPTYTPSVNLNVKKEDRIVHGDTAVKGSWPWQCSLRFKITGGYAQWCGASVLNNKFLLTAAHCMFDQNHVRIPASSFQVVCGDWDQKNSKDPAKQPRYVKTTTPHENYDPTKQDWDLCVLELDQPLTFTDYVKPVCLPSEPVPAGHPCVVTGWGDTMGTADETLLQQVVVPVISQSICGQRTYYGPTLKDNMLCAGYDAGFKDSCQGDSGGPLVCKVNGRWYLQGVVSFGDGCAKPRRPGVYARVLNFLQWVAAKTGVTP